MMAPMTSPSPAAPSHPEIRIGGRPVGLDHPTLVIAELSANHRHDLSRAKELIHAAAEAGADMIKLQTYTPDTITLDCDAECFWIKGGTAWDRRRLHDLYREAYTPWEWHRELFDESGKRGLLWFSTPFDHTAVDFLEEQGVPAYKIGSFELVDLPLLRKVAGTGKPVILSTGMGTLAEIAEAVATLRAAGCSELAILRCVSSYPARPEEMHLATIPHLAATFGVPSGLSDHTLSPAIPVAAVALGACIVEKHLTTSRSEGGPDAGFSVEPAELVELVRAIREVEAARGRVHYGPADRELAMLRYRRSLFVVETIEAGALLGPGNVRSIRPGDGLHPRHLAEVLGMRARRRLEKGTPLSWDLIER